MGAALPRTGGVSIALTRPGPSSIVLVVTAVKRPALKERLAAGELCTGTFLLFLSGGDVVQFCAGLGFDYVIVDMEHGSVDQSRARETIQAARACGIAALVRVAEVQYRLVTRALDAGAEGIVLPRVEHRQQCRNLVRFARFHPDGERGLTTFAGHNDFTPVADVAAFVAAAQPPDAAAGANRVPRRPRAAGRHPVGARHRRLPGGNGRSRVQPGCAGADGPPGGDWAAEQVFTTCRAKGLIYTLPIRSPDDTARWQDAGMRMITLSTDGGLLAAGARQFLASVRRPGR